MKNAFWSLVFLVLILDALFFPAAFSATLSSTFSLSGFAASSSGSEKPDAESLCEEEEKANVRSKEDHVNLEDYRHYDPTPSSKSRIHSGPIEHGSPLNPYVVPKQPPPPPSYNHPKPGPSPSPF